MSCIRCCCGHRVTAPVQPPKAEAICGCVKPEIPGRDAGHQTPPTAGALRRGPASEGAAGHCRLQGRPPLCRHASPCPASPFPASPPARASPLPSTLAPAPPLQELAQHLTPTCPGAIGLCSLTGQAVPFPERGLPVRVVPETTCSLGPLSLPRRAGAGVRSVYCSPRWQRAGWCPVALRLPRTPCPLPSPRQGVCIAHHLHSVDKRACSSRMRGTLPWVLGP